MNIFEKFIYFLQGTMETPVSYGWLHLMWVFLIIISVIFLYKIRHRYNEKQLKVVLFIYGFTAFILELLKQITWSFNYNNGVVVWDYQWYAAPFQLCTTPIFISLICVFLKDNKIRKALLSYMGFTTILGSLMTMIIPDSCFTSDILINIHTMWLHAGSLVVSIYLLMNEVEINTKNLKSSILVFLIFVGIALILNISIYNMGVLNGEEFNMFYISPYFISELPVFNFIQENVPYLIYLLLYILVLSLGTSVVFIISKIIKNINLVKIK